MDIDQYDENCHHFILQDLKTGDLVCVFRALLIKKIYSIGEAYSSQFYDLKPLKNFSGNMLEIGRFCMDENNRDPNILRLAWDALSKFIVQERVTTIFGCASFEGIDEMNYLHAFRLLKEKYLLSPEIRPVVNAERIFEYAKELKFTKINPVLAERNLPPLLRLYLKLGARVSDTAIVDHDLKTIHVFTLFNKDTKIFSRIRAT